MNYKDYDNRGQAEIGPGLVVAAIVFFGLWIVYLLAPNMGQVVNQVYPPFTVVASLLAFLAYVMD